MCSCAIAWASAFHTPCPVCLPSIEDSQILFLSRLDEKTVMPGPRFFCVKNKGRGVLENPKAVSRGYDLPSLAWEGMTGFTSLKFLRLFIHVFLVDCGHDNNSL